jgi:hypothetical protein
MFVIDRKGERPVCRDCRRAFEATAKQVADFRRAGTVILCEWHAEQLRADATRNAEASRVLLVEYWRQFGAV